MAEVRVKVEDPSHAWGLASAAGMMVAQQLLEELPESVRKTPGVALCIATIAAEANALRGSSIARNLRLIARAGHDVAQHSSVHFDPTTSELICEFHDPESGI